MQDFGPRESTGAAPSVAAGDVTPAASFTLPTALSWLGHECSGCQGLTTDWPATVWFMLLPTAANHLWTSTLVQVEVTRSPFSVAGVCRLLDEVNRCVRPDRIQVRPGRASDHRHAASALGSGHLVRHTYAVTIRDGDLEQTRARQTARRVTGTAYDTSGEPDRC
jgi:hypothetical protein